MPAVAGRDLIQALELSIDGHNLQVTGSTSEASTAQRVAIATAPDSLPRSLTDKALGTFPGFEHNITVTKDYTAHVARCRAVPFSKREVVHNEIKAMIDAGIWSPIDKAECAHGLVCVSKKDGSVRITSDLSPLNKYIVPDRHPLPLIEDILLQLHGQQVFLKSISSKDTTTSCWPRKAASHGNNHTSRANGLQPFANGPPRCRFSVPEMCCTNAHQLQELRGIHRRHPGFWRNPTGTRLCPGEDS